MSKNSILLLMLMIVISWNSFSQDHLVQGVSPDLYLSHAVAAKQTWYSIGRQYNLSPKDIAAYNRVGMEKPLEIGQQLNIPLIAANFSQDEIKASTESFIPLYHVVQEKEWMYRISVNYNKVPIERLEKWNGISRDQAKAGTRLIVGYLKVKEGNASLAAKSADEVKPTSQEPVVQKTVEEPLIKKTIEEPKKPEAVVAINKQASSGEGGYFKNLYDDGGKKSSGVTGIFKSTSGWGDGKYYALMNNVTVGTIIKISFPQTNRSVYAKVLGEMPDMKESAGLGLRISDAAAKELGAVNNKFSVDVRY